MVWKPVAFLLLLQLSLAGYSAAQPVLPDMTGAASQASVILSWQCQYSSVKAISVLRAPDSLADFTVIGFVQNIRKGKQVYTDTAPAPGRNCYKLAIEFTSGLVWRSNPFCLKVEIPASIPGQPAGRRPDTSPVSTAQLPQQAPASASPVQPRPRLVMPAISEDLPDSADTRIQPRFFTIDPHSGNLYMLLPDDVSTHHYAARFSDLLDHTVTELPHIHTATAILDRRNFQGKAIIRFVLRRDGVEIEEGYLHMIAGK